MVGGVNSGMGESSAPALTRRHALAGLAGVACASGLASACTPGPSGHWTGAAPGTGIQARPAGAGRPARPDVYAGIGPDMVNPAWAADPVRVYVPNSLSNTVTEIDPGSYRIIR